MHDGQWLHKRWKGWHPLNSPLWMRAFSTSLKSIKSINRVWTTWLYHRYVAPICVYQELLISFVSIFQFSNLQIVDKFCCHDKSHSNGISLKMGPVRTKNAFFSGEELWDDIVSLFITKSLLQLQIQITSKWFSINTLCFIALLFNVHWGP